MTTSLPRLFISISIVVLLSVMVIITNSQLHSWRIDVGTPSARMFTKELRGPESTEIDGNVVTYQWGFPHSTIIIPLYNNPQIIRLRTMMRPNHLQTQSNYRTIRYSLLFQSHHNHDSIHSMPTTIPQFQLTAICKELLTQN